MKARGRLDREAGEFWVENPFMMPSRGHNLSAFERNCLFLNVEGRRFLDASFAARSDIDSDSRSVIVADFDGDYKPDVLVGSVGGGPLRLFRNQFPQSGHRIRLNLVGRESNRSAIGARVILKPGNERTIVRDLFAANGFMGQSPPELLIGVGTAQSVQQMIVRWPNGNEQQFNDVPVDSVITIEEGEDKFRSRPMEHNN